MGLFERALESADKLYRLHVVRDRTIESITKSICLHLRIFFSGVCKHIGESEANISINFKLIFAYIYE